LKVLPSLLQFLQDFLEVQPSLLQFLQDFLEVQPSLLQFLQDFLEVQPSLLRFLQDLEVIEVTSYAGSTVRKYSAILQVKYYGIGRRKTYDWSDADVTRFLVAIQRWRLRPAGRNPKKTSKNFKKNVSAVRRAIVKRGSGGF
jgi:hypothetical protein